VEGGAEKGRKRGGATPFFPHQKGGKREKGEGNRRLSADQFYNLCVGEEGEKKRGKEKGGERGKACNLEGGRKMKKGRKGSVNNFVPGNHKEGEGRKKKKKNKRGHPLVEDEPMPSPSFPSKGRGGGKRGKNKEEKEERKTEAVVADVVLFVLPLKRREREKGGRGEKRKKQESGAQTPSLPTLRGRKKKGGREKEKIARLFTQDGEGRGGTEGPHLRR